MAARTLARGMGTFFKDCEHPESRWSKCPHGYKIQYRNAAGRQNEESGFATQDRAIERLLEIYNEKKTAASRSQSKAERIQKYGAMRFEEYVEEWKAGQRHLAVSSVRPLDSLLEHHFYPALASRRMNSSDHKVVDGFIRAMERAGAGLAAIRTAGDDAFTPIVDLMSGCGLRNGEAAAVNLKNVVADGVYRVSEQVIMSTREWAAEAPQGGGVPQCTKPYPHWRMDNQWRRIRASGEVDIPQGTVLYRNRHFYASNCLSNGIPITDVAEWMGHKSVDVTFKIYRHLLPGSIGKAAQVLDMALAA
ncbi:site-specific integrase [Streptomyces sp. NPDC052101]|uniref:site-specific integrase n=1 Tax=Streptomyces sp. NPDC052101 TaxID=3155763 RepID=UPI0034223A74